MTEQLVPIISPGGIVARTSVGCTDDIRPNHTITFSSQEEHHYLVERTEVNVRTLRVTAIHVTEL
jgi:hypothetical protein